MRNTVSAIPVVLHVEELLKFMLNILSIKLSSCSNLSIGTYKLNCNIGVRSGISVRKRFLIYILEEKMKKRWEKYKKKSGIRTT